MAELGISAVDKRISAVARFKVRRFLPIRYGRRNGMNPLS